MFVRNTKPKHIQRGGFTLVEMLTVIVIIGILAGMIVGASVAVRNAARRALIVAEIKQLETAVQDYKNEVGEFPPDFAFCERTDSIGKEARARVVRHLRKAYPRMRLAGADTEAQFTAFLALLPAGTTVGPGASQLNPSTALTFWLGGMPDADGQPKGFHSDPSNPFKVGEPRTKPHFPFDKNRLSGYQFFPAKIQPAAPYVYFRAVKDADAGKFEYGAHDDTGAGLFQVFSFGSSDNVCVPYLEDAASDNPQGMHDARAWRSPETYQIISAGLDGVYSTNDNTTPPTPAMFRVSKLGVGFSNGDYDNLASFAEGELEDEL